MNTPQAKINQDFLKYLRSCSIIEGTSTLILFFIAMPLKYLADIPMAVTIIGSIHGILFLGICVMFLIAIKKVPITLMWAMVGILCAVIPFGPFIYDLKLKKLA